MFPRFVDSYGLASAGCCSRGFSAAISNLHSRCRELLFGLLGYTMQAYRGQGRKGLERLLLPEQLNQRQLSAYLRGPRWVIKLFAAARPWNGHSG